MENVLLMPARPMEFQVERGIHKVPDEPFSAGLRMCLLDECGDQCTAVIIRSCGNGMIWPAQEYLRWNPDTEQKCWLRDLIVRVNKEAGYFGAWVGAWVGPNHIKLLWLDKDGDLQLTNEIAEPWVRIREYGLDSYVQRADAAIQRWLAFWQDMEVKESQKIKAALGQTRPDQ